MDKIKFARMINVLTQWGMQELDLSQMEVLDRMTTVETTAVQQRAVVSEEDVNQLLLCMKQAGEGRKIDAIKAYRQITNAGLKEAKDAVERYM